MQVGTLASMSVLQAAHQQQVTPSPLQLKQHETSTTAATHIATLHYSHLVSHSFVQCLFYSCLLFVGIAVAVVAAIAAAAAAAVGAAWAMHVNRTAWIRTGCKHTGAGGVNTILFDRVVAQRTSCPRPSLPR